METSLNEYIVNVGKKVSKKNINNNPKYKVRKFKSGLYVNTIKDVILHPILNIPSYTFIEDDSYVECRRCKILN